ncbi:MAG: hypothetical protein JWR75_1970 [Devosia sp.]|nr:hypothetical protein [Devosia sp.]
MTLAYVNESAEMNPGQSQTVAGESEIGFTKDSSWLRVRDGERVREVRHDYERGIGTRSEICEKFLITMNQLKWLVKREDWQRRSIHRVTARKQIIKRLFRILDHNLKHLESKMKTAGSPEVAMLGSLATTLGKLIELDTARQKSPRAKSATKDIEALRRQIARRIDDLANA